MLFLAAEIGKSSSKNRFTHSEVSRWLNGIREELLTITLRNIIMTFSGGSSQRSEAYQVVNE